MNDNFFFSITDAVTRLLTQYSDPIAALALRLYRIIVPTMIIWRGLSIMFSVLSGDGNVGPALGSFVRYLFLCVFVGMVLRHYNSPLPGMSDSLHGTITGGAAQVASQIDTAMTERLLEKFNTVIIGMESPAWYAPVTNFAASLHYYTCVLALLAIQVVVLGVISFGWVAIAVIVLMGPLFIDALLIPALHSYFWNWFSALIQYSFYPAVANAFVYVYAVVLIRFFDTNQGPYTMDKIAGMFLQLLALSLALVFGFFKIPGLVADMFRGSSGQHTMPSIGGWRG